MLDTLQIDRIKMVLVQQKSAGKPRSIVLKLGTDCNLRCKYCYVEHTKEELSLETVERIFDELMADNNNNIDCCFHGGEPFFYFEKMQEIVQLLSSKPYAGQIRFSCQSNGTLLIDRNIDFLEKNKIAIGISIDGPKQVNDMLRVFPDGTGSFDSIMNGIKKLQERGIGFSVLSVISDNNARYAVQTLDFLKSQGIDSVDFKPCFKTDLNEQELSVDLYAQTMLDVLDWLLEHNTPESRILVREIEVYTNLVMNNEKAKGCYDCRSMCDLMNCGAGRDHITIDVDGSVYICDRLYGHSEYILGNINTQRLEEVMSNKLIETFLSRKISSIKECNECDENKICFLGCPATNILQKGNLNEGLYSKPGYCKYFYQIIKRIREVVKNGEYYKLIRMKEAEA